MNKLLTSLSVMALAGGVMSANAQDPECNGKGTLDQVGELWNGDYYTSCILPADIAVDGPYELAKTSSQNGLPILWVLPQVVVVGDGHQHGADPNTVDNTILEIKEGARVVGDIENSALVITRGAQLKAEGTASDPIIFSSRDEGFSGKGEWGGVILSGFGVSNQCNDGADSCLMEGISEGDFYFGGSANTDLSSGSLKHVVITEGGSVVALETDGDPDPNSNSGDEINGLTLYAVNDSTELENIHVHDNLDDGIEFFGGNVSVDNLWLTCNQDDSVDWDHGYHGSIRDVSITQQNGADHAFELANNPNDFGAEPVANATVTNASLLLTGSGSTSDVPFKLKEGTEGTFTNILVEGYGAVDCEQAGNIHGASVDSPVEYDCGNVTDLLPDSGSASGFSSAPFWTAAQGYPGCN